MYCNKCYHQKNNKKSLELYLSARKTYTALIVEENLHVVTFLTDLGASLDFGVFVCLNCSGAHRALGPSVTRVKSTRLDTWNRDWVNKMQIGNTILNLYWEHLLTDADHHMYLLFLISENPIKVAL